MVRFFVALILAGYAAAESQAQVVSSSPVSSSPPSSSPAATAVPQSTASASTSTSRFEVLRKAFDQLSAEQQERIVQNLHRWQDLSQDEKEVLRQRERVQRQKLEASISEAYQKSGLQLNDEQRAQFRKRYLLERRRLEEQIVHDEQEKRQVGNAAIIEMLKKEFSAQKPAANAVAH
jgi:flagellar biosynthesis GTPase FlhF